MTGLRAFIHRVYGNPQIIFDDAGIERCARYYARKFGVPVASLMNALPARSHLAKPSANVEVALRSAAAAPDRLAHFICSTATKDRMDDVIRQDGWELRNYRLNPVGLFAHQSNQLPVAKAVSVGVTDGKLQAALKFASTKMGRAVANLVEQGFLNAVSVGFRPIEFSFSPDPKRPGGIDFKRQELLEISIVPVPANAEAILVGMSDASGKSLPKPKARAKRAREIELIKLKLPPASPQTDKAKRMAEVRAIRQRISR